MNELASADGFVGANLTLTEWLAPGGTKPGAEQFQEIASRFPEWIEAARGREDLLEGLAFLGRLTTLSSWRASDSATKWTADSAAILLQALTTDPYLSLVARWGKANERRFVSNALELVNSGDAQSITIVFCGTETSRNASKATGHHLDCLRRQNISLARILDEVVTCWRRTQKELKVTPTARMIQFENLSTAIALNKWTHEEVGEPDLALFASSVRGAAQEVVIDLRNASAVAFFDLLTTFRQSTPRRQSIIAGYEPALEVLGWYPGRQFPEALREQTEALLDDLEQDLVWQLRLGIRSGSIRECHGRIAGEAHSLFRLQRLAAKVELGEAESLWIRTGKWKATTSGDPAIAEASLQDADDVIAELLIDLSSISIVGDPSFASAQKWAAALGRARRMEVFERKGSVVEFEPAAHLLMDDDLDASGRVVVIRPGIKKLGKFSASVLIKATVKKLEF